jgi:hypothetical protein
MNLDFQPAPQIVNSGCFRLRSLSDRPVRSQGVSANDVYPKPRRAKLQYIVRSLTLLPHDHGAAAAMGVVISLLPRRNLSFHLATDHLRRILDILNFS